jgi:hypothetical protein
MAAGLPDLQPLPVIELPRDASLLGRVALLEEALEKLAESTARQHHLHL